jgi:hypothetical protein
MTTRKLRPGPVSAPGETTATGPRPEFSPVSAGLPETTLELAGAGDAITSPEAVLPDSVHVAERGVTGVATQLRALVAASGPCSPATHVANALGTACIFGCGLALVP